MRSMILGMLAETPIHSGAGRSEGFIDLPVAREAITNYPVILGSSLKGSLRDLARDKGCDDIFGEEKKAGDLLISDAKLLLLPVRSLTTQYKWATCPHIIERLDRDLKLCNYSEELNYSALSIKNGEVVGPGDSKLFLEEREFDGKGEVPIEIIGIIKSLIFHERTRSRLKDQLVVMHDDDFRWFASYGLPVNARNKLDENKKSENLWYEESLAPDTLLYAMLFEKKDGTLSQIKSLFDSRSYLQLGGNETVGMGWFAVKTIMEEANGRK
ncbi:MAG: CRISPR system Cmr subunit Cmr4 [Euryarchaeota archaeon ADurb.Bin190]|jgi:CRISPR-associated protein Cmr4|nr:MAG: CRISPR system Cmr subunit Cmr4 [Euryarchaeota archaeon ADurb.Bin190]